MEVNSTKIFIIKVQNRGSEFIDIICAYDNEDSAKTHVDAYKEIYSSELNADIWYDLLFIKSEFNSNGFVC